MAEAIAVVSLVSAIVSLVQFGNELVERINAFTTHLDEVPAVFRSLKTQLPLMTDNLERTKKHVETGAISDETASALTLVIDSCMQEVSAMKNILDKTIPRTTAPRSKRWIMAIKSLAYDKEIANRTEVLNKNIQSLIHYHATSTADVNSKLLAFALEQHLNLRSTGVSNTSATTDSHRGPEAFLSLPHQHTELREQGSGVHQNMTQADLDDEFTRVVSWIDAVDTTENFQDALIARTTGTCNWIFQNSTFVAWSSSSTPSNSSKALWIHGPPGFGKSVLCASIIQELCQRTASCVGHFFCVAEDESKRQAYGILRSWVYQLMQKQTTSADIARQAYRKRTALKATEPELWVLFESMGLKSGNCIFVVDGFDECDQKNLNSKLHMPDYKISFLRRLLESSTKFTFQLLLVSRYDSSIKSLWTVGLSSLSTIFYEYEISQQDTFDDVNTFSSIVVEQRLSNKKGSDRAEITKDIVERCDGMFLWVRLLEQRLSPGKNVKQLRTIVSETPSDIGKMYAKELERIMNLEEEDRTRAIAILRWTLFATRPLTVQEMTEALLVDIDAKFPPEHSFPSDALPDDYDEQYVDDRIQRLCGPLICLRSSEAQDSVATRTIHFVHFSVQEYLLTVPAQNFEPPSAAIFCDTSVEHAILARACICYLFYLELDDAVIHFEEVYDMLQKFHFLDYAAKSWSVHASQSSTSDRNLHDLLSVFFQSDNREVPFEGWELGSAWKIWDLWPRIVESASDATPNPLYYASLFGFVEIVERLILEGMPLNRVGGEHDYALKAAAVKHHENIVRLLLKHGAKIDIKYPQFGSALIGAVAHGTAEKSEIIAQLLIANGADVSSRDQFDMTALHYAAIQDKTNIIELLLKYGASVDSTDSKGATALHWAAREGSQRAVSLLLNKYPISNKRENDNLMPLHYASIGGQHAIVAMFLDNGADVNTCYESQATPLHCAAELGHLTCVELLLDRGADIDATDSLNTPLSLAATRGNDKIVRLLLDRGANCQPTSRGARALNCAAVQGRVGIMRMLLDAGANIAAVSTHGNTALHDAAYCGQVEIVKFLLDNGANIAAANNGGGTALHGAAYNEQVEVIEVLLDRGADMEAEANDRIRPLHLGARHEGVFNKLLERGAKQDATTKQGANALHIAALCGNESIVRRILDDREIDVEAMTQEKWMAPLPEIETRGYEIGNVASEIKSSIDEAEKAGETAMRVAVRFGHARVASLLFDRWFTSEAATTERRTAVLLAAAKGHADVISILLQRGLDPIIPTETRSLPLYVAAISGHVRTVETLFQHGMELEADSAAFHRVFLKTAHQGHFEIVRLFCEQGAKVHIMEERGRTALHLASRQRHRGVVQTLLEFGADPNLQSQVGLTPFHEALYGGKIGVIMEFLSVPLDLRPLDRYGRTCLDWISLHPALYSRIRDRYAECKPTDEVTKTEILRTTLRDTLRRLVDGEPEPESEYNTLGHCLIFLGELQEACTAFEQEIVSDQGDPFVMHSSFCKNCFETSHICGDRNVCLACPEFDLCKRCKEDNANGGAFHWDEQEDPGEQEDLEELEDFFKWKKLGDFFMCRGHDFLTVPGNDWAQLPRGQVNARGESKEQWLQRLTTMIQ